MLRKQLNTGDLFLIIEILGAVVVLGEIGSAVMGVLHMAEPSGVLHLADTALGGLLAVLVQPGMRGKLMGKTRAHRLLSGHADTHSILPGNVHTNVQRDVHTEVHTVIDSGTSPGVSVGTSGTLRDVPASSGQPALEAKNDSDSKGVGSSGTLRVGR